MNILKANRTGYILKNILEICKFNVVLMLMLTALIGLLLAPENQGIINSTASVLAIGAISCSAAVLNHIFDRKIDKKMARTAKRPLIQQAISLKQALFLAGSLLIVGTVGLLMFSNTLTTILTLLSLVGYALIYTVVLKKLTPQNIVIGGLAGAMPPLLGWSSQTATVNAEAWLLVLIIYTWTPAHFWALAIFRHQDYARANIPMLPNTHSIAFTQNMMVLYSLLTLLVCILPVLIGMSQWLYLIISLSINLYFLTRTVILKIYNKKQDAYRLFTLSIYQIFILFFALLIDHFLL